MPVVWREPRIPSQILARKIQLVFLGKPGSPQYLCGGYTCNWASASRTRFKAKVLLEIKQQGGEFRVSMMKIETVISVLRK